MTQPITVPHMARVRGVTDKDYGLPSHRSEETFRRYEPLIKTAVDNAPNDTSFTIPPDLAPTTFVARLRDTTLSVKKFGWKTDINMEKLWSQAGTMVWHYDHGQKLVWYRAKQPRGRPNQLTSTASAHAKALATTAEQRWLSYTKEELHALCVLLTSGKLHGPVIIPGTVDNAAELETIFNVSFVRDETNNETIIT